VGALGIALILVAASSPRPAFSAEGAASNYFPGSYGNLLVAVAPEPGFLLWSQNFFYTADAGEAVLQGRVNADLDVDAFYTNLNGYYVRDFPSMDMRFMVGGYLPLGYSALETQVSSPALPTRSRDASLFSLGDAGLVPASLYWSVGPIHLNLYEAIIAPTGRYDDEDIVNVGRNYWSFDTVAAATWFGESIGTDVSAVLGIMANTENPDTNYRTGTEFHFDFMLNQFLGDGFGIGFHGYVYDQLSGDSGSGAILGGFKSESVGLGGALFWIPDFADGRLSLVGKWIHDIDATNRLEADYGTLDLVLTF
jgi:hypothetical protein